MTSEHLWLRCFEGALPGSCHAREIVLPLPCCHTTASSESPIQNVCNNGNVPLLTAGIIFSVNIYHSYVQIYPFGHRFIRGGENTCSFSGRSVATIQPPFVQWLHSFQLTTSPQAWTDCPSSCYTVVLNQSYLYNHLQNFLKTLMVRFQSKLTKSESLEVGHELCVNSSSDDFQSLTQVLSPQ